MGESRASMLSGTYQSMVMSLTAGSIAFFRDLISWGRERSQCQAPQQPPCPPQPPSLPGHYLGLQPLGRAQELSTAPAHLGHALQQPPAHPLPHAKAEAPVGESQAMGSHGRAGAGQPSGKPCSRDGWGCLIARDATPAACQVSAILGEAEPLWLEYVTGEGLVDVRCGAAG